MTWVELFGNADVGGETKDQCRCVFAHVVCALRDYVCGLSFLSSRPVLSSHCGSFA